MSTDSIISTKINRIQYHQGEAPRRDPVVRAIIAADLLHKQAYGIDTITKAVVIGNVTRPAVEAALTILQSEDENLLAVVLAGRMTLPHAAAKVRHRAKLIHAFKSASDIDRAAFGRTVGPAAVFDAAVVPAI
jgi:hypothetical protein